MLDWFRLLVALPGCVVACMKLYTLLRRFLRPRLPQATPLRDIVLSLSMIGTLIFAGIGWHETRQVEKQLQECQAKSLIGFGTQRNRFWAQVNMTALKIHAGTQPSNAILLVRAADRTIDENTDRMILKSFLVPIADEISLHTRNIEVMMTDEFLQRLMHTSGLLDARLFLLPNTVSLDTISCFGDVKLNKGRCLAGGFYTIPLTVKQIPHAHGEPVQETH